MLHEIRPGDVVIVTVNSALAQKDIKGINESIFGLGANDVTIIPHKGKTSVHVIRAKKAEDKPKPDWPAWRDVRTEKPPAAANVIDGGVLVFTKDGTIGIGGFDGHDWFTMGGCNFIRSVTHWMPLPEGPIAPTRESDHP